MGSRDSLRALENSFVAARRLAMSFLPAAGLLTGLLIVMLPVSVVAQAPDFSVPDKKSKRVVPPGQRQGPNAGNPNMQGAKPETKPEQTPQKKTRRKKLETPEPEIVTLTTKDDVQLQCTWFPAFGGTDKEGVERDGKLIVPFILLHDWDGSRQDLLLLGRFLQLLGHSAIVPDIRGHGESLKVTGLNEPLDRSKFRKAQIPLMAGDIEECKRFLMTKNNAGELNIDMLNVVAVGQMSVLATQWVISDWSWPPLGSIKQGQDVKSLTLVSPQTRFKSMNATKMFTHPLYAGGAAAPFPVLVVHAADDAEAVKEADEIVEILQKARGRNRTAADPAIQRLVRSAVPGTGANGSKLISDASSQPLFAFIARFVDQAVVSQAEKYPWQTREN